MGSKHISSIWPRVGDVLLVDDDSGVRHAIERNLSAIGCRCHAVPSYAEGRKIFETHPEVGVVILDHGMAGDDAAVFLGHVRASRPETVIVGSSGQDIPSEFQELGVRRFLKKPWTARDLASIVPDRLGACVDCGLPLPLRRERDGRLEKDWICNGCGGRYRGVLDEDFPLDVHRSVRQATDSDR